jgi:membrane-bound acyltransferase YfiQ involved in biofilm formation
MARSYNYDDNNFDYRGALINKMSKRIIVLSIAIIFLLVGAFYGLASAPSYQLILTISILCEAIAFGCFLYSMRLFKTPWRYLHFVGVALTLLILLQAVNRLLA